MPDIYVRKKWAIYNEGLAERLLSGVYQVYTEDEVRSTKLPVPVNKDLGP